MAKVATRVDGGVAAAAEVPEPPSTVLLILSASRPALGEASKSSSHALRSERVVLLPAFSLSESVSCGVIVLATTGRLRSGRGTDALAGVFAAITGGRSVSFGGFGLGVGAGWATVGGLRSSGGRLGLGGGFMNFGGVRLRAMATG